MLAIERYPMQMNASTASRSRVTSVYPWWFRAGVMSGIALLSALAWPISGYAKPDFSRCTINLMKPNPQEGDVVEYSIRVRNTGDEAAEDVQLEVVCPSMGFLLSAEGPVDAHADESPPSVRGSVNLPAGGETLIRMEVLAPRKSSGDVLSLSLRVAHYPSGIEQWEHHSVTIDRRPQTAGVVLGGLQFHPASFWFLAWVFACLLVLGVLAILNRSSVPAPETYAESSIMRRMRSRLPIAPTMLLMIPVAFWMVFGGMAWRDFRVLTAWKQADATIVGRREVVKTSSSSSSRSGNRTSTSSTTYSPEFALRYEVDGKTIISNGFDTGTSLYVGGRVIGEQEYQTWTVGAVIPCWYDPADPRDVVVRRGFGGAYLFAIFPLPLFWFGVVVIRKLIRGRK